MLRSVLVLVLLACPHLTAAAVTPPWYFEMQGQTGSCRVMLFTEETTDSIFENAPEAAALRNIRAKFADTIREITGYRVSLLTLRVATERSSGQPFFVDRTSSLFIINRPGFGWIPEVRLDNQLLARRGVDTLYFQPILTSQPGQARYAFAVFPQLAVQETDQLLFFGLKLVLRPLE